VDVHLAPPQASNYNTRPGGFRLKHFRKILCWDRGRRAGTRGEGGRA
jgi:hypothetical protein